MSPGIRLEKEGWQQALPAASARPTPPLLRFVRSRQGDEFAIAPLLKPKMFNINIKHFVRMSFKRMIALVAAIAVGIVLVREFEEGLPPRFVVRGIPGRINRLRPGMSWEETRSILGLEQSWFRGCTDAQQGALFGNNGSVHVTYYVRPLRAVVVTARVAGGPPSPVECWQSTAFFTLVFRKNYNSDIWEWKQDKSTELVKASFSGDFTRIAEMPGSQ